MNNNTTATARTLWIVTQPAYRAAVAHLHRDIMACLADLGLPPDGFRDAPDLTAALRSDPGRAEKAVSAAHHIEKQIEELRQNYDDRGKAFDREMEAANAGGT